MFKRKDGIMSFNYIAFIPRIIFLVIALLACVILIKLMLNAKFWTKPLQTEILLNGLLYGPGGVTEYDPVTGRIYPEIVDVTQMNSANLDLGLNFPENKLMAARIVVTEGKQEKAGLGNYADPKGIAYYNKEMWEWWLPLAKASIAGLGGFDVDDSEIPILFRDKNGELHADYYMYVVVVQPK